MADILKAVRSVLANDAGVSALVSTRIYPDRVPQAAPTYPLIVVQLVTEESVVNMTGISGLGQSRVQVDYYAKTRLEAATGQEAVRLALTHYNGTSQSVVVRRILPSTGTAFYDDPQDKSDLGLYRHVRDYNCHYVEATS